MTRFAKRSAERMFIYRMYILGLMTSFAIAKEISREDVYSQDVNPGSYDKVCYSI